MKCPRCRTENDNRTVCKKCGFYLYRATSVNVVNMTKAERAKEDARLIGKGLWKVFRVVWMILTLIVMSFLILAGLLYLTNGQIGLW